MHGVGVRHAKVDLDAHRAPTHGAACILNADAPVSTRAALHHRQRATIANTQDDGLERTRHGSDLAPADKPLGRTTPARAARSRRSHTRRTTLAHSPRLALPLHLHISLIFHMFRLCERPRCTLLYRSTLGTPSVPDFPLLRAARSTPPPPLYFSFARRSSTASCTHLLSTLVFPSIFSVSPVPTLTQSLHSCSYTFRFPTSLVV